MSWGNDNDHDRRAGEEAEAEAVEQMRRRGHVVTPHPMGRSGFDILVEGETIAPRVCEVRAKYPDRKDRYGLEAWKVPLWIAADVVYLVKDTKREGWYWAEMRKLPPYEDGLPGSYMGGVFDATIPNAYWSVEHWHRLKWER